MDEHDLLRSLIDGLKDNINEKINTLITEFRTQFEQSRLNIKELYEERNRLEKSIIKLDLKTCKLDDDINQLGKKVDAVISEKKENYANVFWKIVIPVLNAVIIVYMLLFLKLK